MGATGSFSQNAHVMCHVMTDAIVEDLSNSPEWSFAQVHLGLTERSNVEEEFLKIWQMTKDFRVQITLVDDSRRKIGGEKQSKFFQIPHPTNEGKDGRIIIAS